MRLLQILPPQAPRRVFVLALLFAVGIAIAAAAWWSRETVTELDITSGTLRRRTLVLGVCVRDRREHTWVSRALALPQSHAGDWHVILQEGFRHNARVNYRFGGAVASIRAFEDLRRIIPLAPDAEHLVAERVVELWQRDQGRDGALDFLRGVEDRIGNYGGSGRQLTAEDIGL